jgi:RNA polymerase sigma-70 factor (ECF subfamily)
VLSSDDAALVAAIARADASTADAELAFCRRYGARVRRFAEHHLRDAQAAVDVAQDVLVTVIRAMREGRVESPESLGAFVLGTCRHRVWDENRAEGRRRRAEAEAERVMEVAVSPPTDRKDLERCLFGLSTRERGVVFLTFAEGWSSEQIAGELSTTAGNVRVVRHRALAKLAGCLGGEASATEAAP